MHTDEEKSLTQIIERLREDSYIYDFVITDNKLTAKDINKSYSPQEVVIEKMFRFEGTSDPADMSIVYAVKTDDDKRGIIVNAFGTYGDTHVDDFMKNVNYPTENKV